MRPWEPPCVTSSIWFVYSVSSAESLRQDFISLENKDINKSVTRLSLPKRKVSPRVGTYTLLPGMIRSLCCFVRHNFLMNAGNFSLVLDVKETLGEKKKESVFESEGANEVLSFLSLNTEMLNAWNG